MDSVNGDQMSDQTLSFELLSALQDEGHVFVDMLEECLLDATQPNLKETRLQQQCDEFAARNIQLTHQLQAAKIANAKLQAKHYTLRHNFSTLHRLAVSKLKQKDKEIASLRKCIHQLLMRNTNPNDSAAVLLDVLTASAVNSSHCTSNVEMDVPCHNNRSAADRNEEVRAVGAESLLPSVSVNNQLSGQLCNVITLQAGPNLSPDALVPVEKVSKENVVAGSASSDDRLPIDCTDVKTFSTTANIVTSSPKVQPPPIQCQERATVNFDTVLPCQLVDAEMECQAAADALLADTSKTSLVPNVSNSLDCQPVVSDRPNQFDQTVSTPAKGKDTMQCKADTPAKSAQIAQTDRCAIVKSSGHASTSSTSTVESSIAVNQTSTSVSVEAGKDLAGASSSKPSKDTKRQPKRVTVTTLFTAARKPEQQLDLPPVTVEARRLENLKTDSAGSVGGAVVQVEESSKPLKCSASTTSSADVSSDKSSVKKPTVQVSHSRRDSTSSSRRVVDEVETPAAVGSQNGDHSTDKKTCSDMSSPLKNDVSSKNDHRKLTVELPSVSTPSSVKVSTPSTVKDVGSKKVPSKMPVAGHCKDTDEKNAMKKVVDTELITETKVHKNLDENSGIMLSNSKQLEKPAEKNVNKRKRSASALQEVTENANENEEQRQKRPKLDTDKIDKQNERKVIVEVTDAERLSRYKAVTVDLEAKSRRNHTEMERMRRKYIDPTKKALNKGEGDVSKADLLSSSDDDERVAASSTGVKPPSLTVFTQRAMQRFDKDREQQLLSKKRNEQSESSSVLPVLDSSKPQLGSDDKTDAVAKRQADPRIVRSVTSTPTTDKAPVHESGTNQSGTSDASSVVMPGMACKVSVAKLHRISDDADSRKVASAADDSAAPTCKPATPVKLKDVEKCQTVSSSSPSSNRQPAAPLKSTRTSTRQHTSRAASADLVEGDEVNSTVAAKVECVWKEVDVLVDPANRKDTENQSLQPDLAAVHPPPEATDVSDNASQKDAGHVAQHPGIRRVKKTSKKESKSGNGQNDSSDLQPMAVSACTSQQTVSSQQLQLDCRNPSTVDAVPAGIVDDVKRSAVIDLHLSPPVPDVPPVEPSKAEIGGLQYLTSLLFQSTVGRSEPVQPMDCERPLLNEPCCVPLSCATDVELCDPRISSLHYRQERVQSPLKLLSYALATTAADSSIRLRNFESMMQSIKQSEPAANCPRTADQSSSASVENRQVRDDDDVDKDDSANVDEACAAVAAAGDVHNDSGRFDELFDIAIAGRTPRSVRAAVDEASKSSFGSMMSPLAGVFVAPNSVKCPGKVAVNDADEDDDVEPCSDHESGKDEEDAATEGHQVASSCLEKKASTVSAVHIDSDVEPDDYEPCLDDSSDDELQRENTLPAEVRTIDLTVEISQTTCCDSKCSKCSSCNSSCSCCYYDSKSMSSKHAHSFGTVDEHTTSHHEPFRALRRSTCHDEENSVSIQDVSSASLSVGAKPCSSSVIKPIDSARDEIELSGESAARLDDGGRRDKGSENQQRNSSSSSVSQPTSATSRVEADVSLSRLAAPAAAADKSHDEIIISACGGNTMEQLFGEVSDDSDCSPILNRVVQKSDKNDDASSQGFVNKVQTAELDDDCEDGEILDPDCDPPALLPEDTRNKVKSVKEGTVVRNKPRNADNTTSKSSSKYIDKTPPKNVKRLSDHGRSSADQRRLSEVGKSIKATTHGGDGVSAASSAGQSVARRPERSPLKRAEKVMSFDRSHASGSVANRLRVRTPQKAPDVPSVPTGKVSRLSFDGAKKDKQKSDPPDRRHSLQRPSRRR